MKPSELPGARRLYRFTNRALPQIKELWQYAAGTSFLRTLSSELKLESVRILHIDLPLSAKRHFQLLCSVHFPDLAVILRSEIRITFNAFVAFLLFTSSASATDVSIRISNGETVTLVKTGDVFDRAENELARVTTSGLFDDRERGRTFMRWVFSIHFKQPAIVRNVRVEDVTDKKPVVLIEDDSPNVTADLWTGRGSAIPFNTKYLPWFFERGDSTRVFRVVIREKSGRSYELHQGACFSANKKNLMWKAITQG